MRGWMPAGMSPAEVDGHVTAATWPDGTVDWHLAAALAWESWAAQQPADGTGGVVSVSTGAQSVTYRDGAGPGGEAFARARFHRARARVRSVPVGPGVFKVDRAAGWEEPADAQPGWRFDRYGQV